MIHLSGTPGGGANHARTERRAIGGRDADARPATCRDRCCRRARRTVLPESSARSPERARTSARFRSGRAGVPALGRALRPARSALRTAGALADLPVARPGRSVRARRLARGRRSAPARCSMLEQKRAALAPDGLEAPAPAGLAVSAPASAARRGDRPRERGSVPSSVRACAAPTVLWERRAAEYASPAGQAPPAASPALARVRAAVAV